MVQLAYCVGAELEHVPTSMRLATMPGLGAIGARVPPTRSMVRSILKQLGLGPALDDGRLDPTAVDWFHSLLRDTPTLRNELAANPDLVHWRRGMNPEIRFDDALLASATTPSLFIWSEGDPIGGAHVARSFVDRIPGARLELLDDTSHAPWITQPERCADLVSEFLTA